MAKYRTIREKLGAQLADIMGANVVVKSSTLLQAYATFRAMSALNESNFAAAYRSVLKENKACKWAILRGLPKVISEEYPPVFDSFIEITFADFFRFVVPELVGDPFQFNRFSSEQYDDNLMLCVHHIIQVKLVAYSKLQPAEIADSTYEGAVNKLYVAYEKMRMMGYVILAACMFVAVAIRYSLSCHCSNCRSWPATGENGDPDFCRRFNTRV